MHRIGVLLGGCGRYDGTEIHEAVLVQLALDRAGAKAEFLAPTAARAGCVDHGTGQLVEGEERSVLAESARLSRGRILTLAEARVPLLAGLIIPGGQGVVRTMMQGVGEVGRRREADPEVAGLIRAVVEAGKPLGSVSLAGSLVATVLGLPLEEDPFSVPPFEIRVDDERRHIWTPGYLTGDRISEVATGIDRMVGAVLERASKGLPVLP